MLCRGRNLCISGGVESNADKDRKTALYSGVGCPEIMYRKKLIDWQLIVIISQKQLIGGQFCFQ